MGWVHRGRPVKIILTSQIWSTSKVLVWWPSTFFSALGALIYMLPLVNLLPTLCNNNYYIRFSSINLFHFQLAESGSCMEAEPGRFSLTGCP